jgi:hypothetical protein
MIAGALFLQGPLIQRFKNIGIEKLRQLNPWVTLLSGAFLVMLPLAVCTKASLYTMDNLAYMLPAAALITWLACAEKLNLHLSWLSSPLAVLRGRNQLFVLFNP